MVKMGSLVPSYRAQTEAGVPTVGRTVFSHHFVRGNRHTADHLTIDDASKVNS